MKADKVTIIVTEADLSPRDVELMFMGDRAYFHTIDELRGGDEPVIHPELLQAIEADVSGLLTEDE